MSDQARVLGEARELFNTFDLEGAKGSSCYDHTLTACYVLVSLLRGEATTTRDVHDAWSVATAMWYPTHKCLVCFDDLAPGDKAKLDEFRDLIRAFVREHKS